MKKKSNKAVAVKKKTVIARVKKRPAYGGGDHLTGDHTLSEFVNRALRTGKWLIAILRVEDGSVYLDRVAANFPTSDVTVAARLVVEEFDRLKG